MSRRISWILVALLVVTSVILASCGPAEEEATPMPELTEPPAVEETEPPEATEVPEATEEPEEEPTEVPEEEPEADIDCMGAEEGDEIAMLYQWSGVEEDKLNQILRPLVDECGISLAPESTRDQALLDTRVQGGNPPDIAFWTASAMDRFEDELQPIDEVGGNPDNYVDFYRERGTRNDRWIGLPVKADIKTIIWYSPVFFDAYGYEVPETWDELDALVEQMVDDGRVPWSMGFASGDATGWTGSDFIQDILLVNEGPEYVLDIISGDVRYDDDGVREAYQIYGEWAKDPAYTVGGAEGTLSTGFVEAIYKVFSDPPEAMMVKQSGFAGGEIQAQYPDLEYGTDYDFFGVPGAQGVQGGMSYMMVFNDTPAVNALVTYLTSETGARNWAEADFDLSPNRHAVGNYPDPELARKADILDQATGFTPDLGDAIPGGFANAEWEAIVDYVNDATDLDTALTEVAEVQQEALD